MFKKKKNDVKQEPELSKEEICKQECDAYLKAHTCVFGELKIYVGGSTFEYVRVVTNKPMNADVVEALLQLDGVNSVEQNGRYKMSVEVAEPFFDPKEVTGNILDTMKTIVTTDLETTIVTNEETQAHGDEMRKMYEDTIGITSCMRGHKMVDFSDITNEDIVAQWELLCEQESQMFDAFAAKHPAWKGFQFKPGFETVEAYKRYLYESIQRYKNATPLLFDESHEVMQKLHDNLKSHTL